MIIHTRSGNNLASSVIVEIVAAVQLGTGIGRREHANVLEALASLPEAYFIGQSRADLLNSDKILLLEIWDFSCGDCISGIPFLSRWHREYGGENFNVAAVHCPEFAFGGPLKNLKRAVEHLEIDYPVVHDPEFEIWSVLDNKYWPSRYLISPSGGVLYHHFGSGRFSCTEASIVKNLKKSFGIGNRISLEKTEREGDFDLGVATVYFGKNYSVPQNQIIADENGGEYELPDRVVDGSYAFGGRWRRGVNSSTYLGEDRPGALSISFTGTQLSIILAHAREDAAYDLNVTENGEPVSKNNGGADLEWANGNTYVHYDFPRLYRIIAGGEAKSRTITITSPEPLWRIYAGSYG